MPTRVEFKKGKVSRAKGKAAAAPAPDPLLLERAAILMGQEHRAAHEVAVSAGSSLQDFERFVQSGQSQNLAKEELAKLRAQAAANDKARAGNRTLAATRDAVRQADRAARMAHAEALTAAEDIRDQVQMSGNQLDTRLEREGHATRTQAGEHRQQARKDIKEVRVAVKKADEKAHSLGERTAAQLERQRKEHEAAAQAAQALAHQTRDAVRSVGQDVAAVEQAVRDGTENGTSIPPSSVASSLGGAEPLPPSVLPGIWDGGIRKTLAKSFKEMDPAARAAFQQLSLADQKILNKRDKGEVTLSEEGQEHMRTILRGMSRTSDREIGKGRWARALRAAGGAPHSPLRRDPGSSPLREMAPIDRMTAQFTAGGAARGAAAAASPPDQVGSGLEEDWKPRVQAILDLAESGPSNLQPAVEALLAMADSVPRKKMRELYTYLEQLYAD